MSSASPAAAAACGLFALIPLLFELVFEKIIASLFCWRQEQAAGKRRAARPPGM
jgi:hypothetical protein